MINKIGYIPLRNYQFIPPLKQESKEQNTRNIQDISNIYYTPISFKGGPTLEEKLKQIEPLHCPVCGVEMLSKEKFEEIKSKKCETMEELINHVRENKQYIPVAAQGILEKLEYSYNIRPDIPPHISIGIIFTKLINSETYYLNNLKGDLKKYSEEHNFNKKDRETSRQISLAINSYLNKECTLPECRKKVTELATSLENEEKDPIVKEFNKTFKKIMIERFCLTAKNYATISPDERVEIFLSKLFTSSQKDFHILKSESSRFNEHPVLTCNSCKQSKDSIIDRNLTATDSATNLAKYFEDIYAHKGLDNELKQHVLMVRYAAEAISKESVNLSKLTSPEFDEIKNEIFNSESISVQFDLVNEPGVPCAACNTTTLTYEEKQKLRAEVTEAKDMHELGDIIKRNLKHIKPLYQEVYKKYDQILEENPDITEDEMVERLRSIYNNNLTHIFNNIANFAKEKMNDPKTSYFEKTTYEYYLEKTKDKYTEINDIICVDDYFQIFNDTLANIDNRENRNQFYNLKDGLWENSMLQSLLHPPAEYSKGEESKLRDIINFTFAKASASVDHMVAKSKGGSNDRKNFMILCNDCNKHKKNKKFSFWISKEPEAVENMQKYIFEIDKIVKERGLTKYRSYAREFAFNVSRLMKDKIRFILPEKD